MTMRITVKNEDATRSAVVQTRDMNPAKPEESAVAEEKTLAPGESAEFWIHSARKIEVLEVVEEKPVG